MPWSENNHLSRNEKMLEEAKELFASSEWVLDILRTQTAIPPKAPTPEDILQWYKALKSKR